MAKKNKLQSYTLDQIKDELIGPIGRIDRDIYEFELKMELFGEMIKKARVERKLTQARGISGCAKGSNFKIREECKKCYHLYNN